MAKHFVLALVHKENDVYGISFPDYRGCVSTGSSFEEAVNKGGNALSFHLAGMAADGDHINLPTDAEALLPRVREDLEEGALPALIEIEFPGKAVRINVSMEEGLLARIDKVASQVGLSRSAFLADAAKLKLAAAS